MPRLPSTQVRAESMLMAMPNWSQAGQSAAVCNSGVRMVPPVANSAMKKAPVPARSTRSSRSSCLPGAAIAGSLVATSRSNRKDPTTSSVNPAHTSRKCPVRTPLSGVGAEDTSYGSNHLTCAQAGCGRKLAAAATAEIHFSSIGRDRLTIPHSLEIQAVQMFRAVRSR